MAPPLFEVKRVFVDFNDKELAPSKDEETFIVFALAPFQVRTHQNNAELVKLSISGISLNRFKRDLRG